VITVHEHFGFDNRNQSGFLAQRGVAGQGLRVGLDATPAGTWSNNMAGFAEKSTRLASNGVFAINRGACGQGRAAQRAQVEKLPAGNSILKQFKHSSVLFFIAVTAMSQAKASAEVISGRAATASTVRALLFTI
jgi:hypothetical protein